MAMRADVLVIAIHAAEGLPLPFYVWTQAWLPHRAGSNVALIALITIPERPSLPLERAREYLRGVARQGRFDFLLEERKLEPGFGQETVASGRVRKQLLSYASRRWRMNEQRVRSQVAA